MAFLGVEPTFMSQTPYDLFTESQINDLFTESQINER